MSKTTDAVDAFNDVVINSYTAIGNWKELSKTEQRLILTGKLTNEAGEVNDEICKNIWYGDRTDTDTDLRVLDELSDVLYSLLAVLDNENITLEHLAVYAKNKFDLKNARSKDMGVIN